MTVADHLELFLRAQIFVTNNSKRSALRSVRSADLGPYRLVTRASVSCLYMNRHIWICDPHGDFSFASDDIGLVEALLTSLRTAQVLDNLARI